jgi:DegV family protein with EDD domain
MKIRFVTDSTADVPADLASQRGIDIVPALVNIGSESYTDGIEISRESYYTRLPELIPPPTTASPSVGSFQERYENLLQHGADFVVSIHPPNELSGIFNAARLAAETFGQRVKVLDSGQVSLGMGFQVIMAAEAAAQGAILEEVTALVTSVRQRVRLAALLDTMEYIHRSGRVSWAVAKIGGILHLKPLVELRYGIVHQLGQARTRLQGIRRLMEALNSWGPLERLAVLHTNAESSAMQLLEEVKSKVPIEPLLVNVTTAIGTHVGPNGLGFTAVTAKP